MHRRYSLLLVGLALAAVLGFAAYGHFLEPLSGDLTRIGWYAENDYGWNAPKHRFDPPLAEEGRLDGRYDVIAAGDSFTASHIPGVAWPHFLARTTGLRTAIFDTGIDSIEDILASPVFRDQPPALFLYEAVERHLVPSHRGSDAPCVATQPGARVTVEARPLPVSPLRVERPLHRGWDDWPVSYALNFIVQNAWRALVGHETTTAVGMEMTRSELFSSRFDRGLLVYGEDFNKASWSEADWRRAACDLLALQERVEANGRTVFAVMVVPDKLSVYSRFLPYRSFDAMSRLPLLAEVPGLHLVRLDDRLDPTAQPDLYLPNDTHWSSEGHALAARLVAEHLEQRGVLRPASSAARSAPPNPGGAGG